MNFCHPDSSKSCAACCGVYNVRDGRRKILNASIRERTRIFRTVTRDIDAIVNFSNHVGSAFDLASLDPEIHVCEYLGFVDLENLTIGCMLHPNAPGNNGIDLRGLCYYGSVACKTFYCPACTGLDFIKRELAQKLIQDWHLYGLVATDINYLSALIGLVELALGEQLDLEFALRDAPAAILGKMFDWKESWPYRGNSTIRRSCYYAKLAEAGKDRKTWVNLIKDILCFTYDLPRASREWGSHIEKEIEVFVKVYFNCKSNKFGLNIN
ncbi:MAG: hypothetical protein ACP5U1_05300 [Desulfomonilaceae bacterium]